MKQGRDLWFYPYLLPFFVVRLDLYKGHKNWENLLIYVHKYIIFQLPLKDEKAVSGIESIVFNVVPFCRVITHLKEEVATDRKFEVSSCNDTQYLL